MTDVVTLDAESQVVIPETVLKALNLKPGRRLLVGIEGDRVVMIPEPEDYVKKLRGLHKEVWAGMDTENYLRGERDSWNEA